ncbi:MAG: peptide deformylase [Alphaproteobacteria bacterium]|nr:peptide deformylase [Alphaproteobacteria bacterium]MDD9919976.1 peptide deformylase [Alphaproteobacteria bacterium]
MTILPIYLHPHPVLRQKAEPVTEITSEIRQILDDMVETLLNHENGVGLAANQIGVLKRLVVLDFTADRLEDELPTGIGTDGVVRMINPEVVSTTKEVGTFAEGCLSIPFVYTDIQRPAAHIRYLDENGETKELHTEISTLLNHVILHEIDHLDGIEFPDHLSRIKRGMTWKKYKKVLPAFREQEPYPYIEE